METTNGGYGVEMTRSQAVEAGNIWQSRSGEMVRVTAVIRFPRIRFVKYVAVNGLRERTLDQKAFLHLYTTLQVK